MLSIVGAAPLTAPTNKGRLMFVEDVQELLPKKDGKPVSRWFLNHNFFPEGKMKIGRANAWWEHEILAHLDATKGRRSA